MWLLSCPGPTRARYPAVIAVLDYGIGNLRSAEKALQHLGADAELVDDPDLAAGADGVVLPGVGAFGRCAQALRSSGLDKAASFAIEQGVPFLGICVGFQLLYEGSDEDPSEQGLGVLAGTVRRLPDGVKHPQMQWNLLEQVRGDDSGLLAGVPQAAWVYFVHSYAPELTADTSSTCDYGGPITASAERGGVWGTQFHPEKSGAVGLGILANFVREVAGAPA
jgi:imidazole glycerol-phosphate synthase subunit HisH